jgi:biotin transporter BioY
MLRVGLEPTIRVFELPKTVHALDRAATVISARSGWYPFYIFLVINVIGFPAFAQNSGTSIKS